MFEMCTFQNAECSGYFVYASNAALNFSFESCVFSQINSGGHLIYIQRDETGVIDRCCFSEDVSNYVYCTGDIPYFSANSTTCTNSNSSPHAVPVPKNTPVFTTTTPMSPTKVVCAVTVSSQPD